MKRGPFWPGKTAEQVVLLLNYATKLPTYQAALVLTVAQVTAAVADAQWLAYVLGTFVPSIRTFSEAVTKASTAAQKGDGLALAVLPVFTPPALPAGVAATMTGALDRFFSFAEHLRTLPTATDTILADLGLLGNELTGPDYNTIAPEFKATRTADSVRLDWSFGKYRKFLTMVEIQVDRGSGWQMLAFDTTPGYDDTFAQPATVAMWKYRMIFRVEDERVGQWSAEVSVRVGG